MLVGKNIKHQQKKYTTGDRLSLMQSLWSYHVKEHI